MMFDNWRAKRREKSERKQRRQAVWDNLKKGSVEAVRAALDAVRGDNFDAEAKSWVLKYAIDRQDMGVFREALGFVGNPDHTIQYTTGVGSDLHEHTYFPLTYAIEVARTHDIALALASNPATTPNDRMLNGARKGGMQSVAAVIARRIADIRREEAAQLDRDAVAAEMLPPPMPPTPSTIAEGEDVPLAPGESWALMSKTSLAHVTMAEAIGRKLTEVFNFESRDRVIITENLKTGAESIGTPESFDRLAPDAVKKAETMLRRLNAEAGNAGMRL